MDLRLGRVVYYWPNDIWLGDITQLALCAFVFSLEDGIKKGWDLFVL